MRRATGDSQDSASAKTDSAWLSINDDSWVVVVTFKIEPRLCFQKPAEEVAWLLAPIKYRN